MRRALEHVRTVHAHFNASNGADHFMVFSYDHARCDLAPGLRLSEWGQLFSIQSYGDLTYTCASHMRSQWRNTYKAGSALSCAPMHTACSRAQVRCTGDASGPPSDRLERRTVLAKNVKHRGWRAHTVSIPATHSDFWRWGRAAICRRCRR